MILAVDIGGTKTQLALFKADLPSPLRPGEIKTPQALITKYYCSTDFNDFDDLLSEFIQDASLQLQQDVKIRQAAIAVAGPIVGEACQLTNLAWKLSSKHLSEKFKINRVILLNDLQAASYAMPYLPTKDFKSIQKGHFKAKQILAVISPGTGLGEAVLYWDTEIYHAVPSEAGHADFAPVNNLQTDLVNFCRVRDGDQFKGHVSNERVLSGSAIADIYEFLLQGSYKNIAVPAKNILTDHDPEVWSALISTNALNNTDSLCIETMKIYISMLASEAGNLALRSLAYGGIIIAGGIAPKILPLLESDLFRDNFCAKGRFQKQMQQVPVLVCLNPQAPLLGALYKLLNMQ